MGYYEWKEAQRKANREWVESLKVPIEEKGSMLSIKVLNRRIDFWPSSNTWYSHALQKYGTGIKEMVMKIQAALQKEGPHAASQVS